MTSFKQKLIESKRTYDFKVKIAGTVTTEQEDTLKLLLAKYQIVEFKKAGKTPVQSFPLDFPRLTNEEVNIYEVVLDYPVASWELQNYLGNGLRINEQSIVVRRPGEPLEEYQKEPPKSHGPLLTDNEFKEAPCVNFKDYYGDAYNMSLVKTLNDDLKAQHKARGQIIPGQESGQTTNDLPQGKLSPIEQASYNPRKK